MNETKEKDYFWVYVGGVIVTALIVLMMVRGGEHDKYTAAAKAISEDSSNSAYFQKK
jgi:hypothetical protein